MRYHVKEAAAVAQNDSTVWPPVLYHYTDAAGLVGILKPSWSGDVEKPAGGAAQLRASDVRFMNDSRELGHGLDLLRGRLRAETRADFGTGDIDAAFELLAERIEVALFAGSTAKHLRCSPPASAQTVTC